MRIEKLFDGFSVCFFVQFYFLLVRDAFNKNDRKINQRDSFKKKIFFPVL